MRNNGVPPEGVNIYEWTLSFSVEVENPVTLTIDELKNQFEVIELALQIECGG